MLVLCGMTGCSGGTGVISSPNLSTPATSVFIEEATNIPVATVQVEKKCPKEMVNVANAFCVDRYEAFLVDSAKGLPLSPYYTPDFREAHKQFMRWFYQSGKSGRRLDLLSGIPGLPAWQLEGNYELKAMSHEGVVPNGYLTKAQATEACTNANKRLCQSDEWKQACRGEKNTDHPYGNEYVAGECNIVRGAHPSQMLTGDAGINHDDPRLNLVEDKHGEPLLRSTGETKHCVSQWGDDGIYDMEGNLDEWVESKGRGFRGGFYSRVEKTGCSIVHGGHAEEYYDYSLGVRCCRNVN